VIDDLNVIRPALCLIHGRILEQAVSVMTAGNESGVVESVKSWEGKSSLHDA